MRISDWSSDVCSSDLDARGAVLQQGKAARQRRPLGIRDRPEPGARCALPLKAGSGKGRRKKCWGSFPCMRSTGPALQPARAAEAARRRGGRQHRSEEHTSELQSLKRISYDVLCLNKEKYVNSCD